VSTGQGRERHPDIELPEVFPPEVRELYKADPITLGETQQELGTLKNGKAAGCDEIPAEIGRSLAWRR
jgi:hypothetical protein